LPVPGVRILGPLPQPYGNATAYRAAVMSVSRSPDAASAFIAALANPRTRTAWQEAGFEAV
jgi:ABC-type molybdate transport system substrate-binding protein